jgi:hypothetical protein
MHFMQGKRLSGLIKMFVALSIVMATGGHQRADQASARLLAPRSHGPLLLNKPRLEAGAALSPSIGAATRLPVRSDRCPT